MRAGAGRDNAPKRLLPADDVSVKRRASPEAVLPEERRVLRRGDEAQEGARDLGLVRARVHAAREHRDALQAVRKGPDIVDALLVDELGYLLEADVRLPLRHELGDHAAGRGDPEFGLHLVEHAQALEQLIQIDAARPGRDADALCRQQGFLQSLFRAELRLRRAGLDRHADGGARDIRAAAGHQLAVVDQLFQQVGGADDGVEHRALVQALGEVGGADPGRGDLVLRLFLERRHELDVRLLDGGRGEHGDVGGERRRSEGNSSHQYHRLHVDPSPWGPQSPLPLIRQRIRPQLDMHGARAGAFAAFHQPGRAITARAPEAAALPAGIWIVDAAVEALGVVAHRIRDADHHHLAVLQGDEAVVQVRRRHRHVLAEPEGVVLVDPGVIARLGARLLALESRPRVAVERPAFGAVLAGGLGAVERRLALTPVEGHQAAVGGRAPRHAVLVDVAAADAVAFLGQGIELGELALRVEAQEPGVAAEYAPGVPDGAVARMRHYCVRARARGNAHVPRRIHRLVRLGVLVPPAVAIGVEHERRPALRARCIAGL